MFKPPQRARRDANEPLIFAALRAHGLSVCPTDKPLDAVVSYKGYTCLVEVKSGPKARLTPAQVAFLAEWQGHAVVIRDVDEAIAFAKAVRAEARRPGD